MIHTHSVAFTESIAAQLRGHLVRADGQEDICFGVWFPSVGATRTTAIINHVILPEEGDRQLHSNASFNGQYFERALRSALRHGGGVVLLHSHPLGVVWQGMSDDDVVAEAGHAGAAAGATGLPLLGLTLAVQSGVWSARFWRRIRKKEYVPDYCDTVRIVGQALSLSFGPSMPVPKPKPELLRTVSVWGDEKQADLSRLHVGVVGAGSVGALVAEALARMGLAQVSLIDFDTIERHNLDRLLHSSTKHIGEEKVNVLAEALRDSATADGFRVSASSANVTRRDGYDAALDCDVLFSCVDRPWPKRVLNHIAYAHLIPVVDGGLAIYAPGGKLKHADWSVRTVGPGRACLECAGAYDPGLVAAEMEGYLDDPKYIEGLPDDHMLRRNENVFPFSMSVAAHEVLQLIALVTGMKRMNDLGEQRFHYYPGTMDRNTTLKCAPGCPHVAIVAMTDKRYRVHRE